MLRNEANVCRTDSSSDAIACLQATLAKNKMRIVFWRQKSKVGNALLRGRTRNASLAAVRHTQQWLCNVHTGCALVITSNGALNVAVQCAMYNEQ